MGKKRKAEEIGLENQLHHSTRSREVHEPDGVPEVPVTAKGTAADSKTTKASSADASQDEAVEPTQ
jgi:hypothetical protein